MQMPRYFVYKLTTDNGGAPCVTRDLLTLAICKPGIRRSARKGDYLFGFVAKGGMAQRMKRIRGRRAVVHGALIYVAKVDRILECGKYYERVEYSRRGDCIYKWRKKGLKWKAMARYHSQSQLEHDCGKPPSYLRARVLLCLKFRYFGRDAHTVDANRYKDVAHLATRKLRNYMVFEQPDNPLVLQLRKLFDDSRMSRNGRVPKPCEDMRDCRAKGIQCD